MHFNVLVVPTLMLSIGLFWLGSTFERKARTAVTRSGIVVAGILLAIPGCLFVFYYVHLFDNSAWFYVFRAAPFTELTAAGLGFIAGFIHSTMAAEGFGEKLIVPGILAFLVVIPFAKPLLSPLEYGALKDRWDGEVCLQSTFSTCGPASAATILKGLGHQASERELAEECFTYRGGRKTGIWHVLCGGVVSILES